MNKTIFEITKMDCPSEENLIRMKLDGISSIANLDFDIPNRKLTVFHSGETDQIEKSVIELNLGGKKISTEQTDQTEFNVETPDIVYHPRRVKVTIAGRTKVTHPRRAKVTHL